MIKMSMKEQKKLFGAIGLVFSLFTMFFLVLLLIQTIQINRVNYLDHPALTSALNNPESSDQWKKQVRELDLMVRQAFFTAEEQIRIISVMIVIFFLAAVFCLKRYFYLDKKSEDATPDQRQKKRTIAFWVVSVAAGFFCLVVIAAGLFGVFLEPGKIALKNKEKLPEDWIERRANWPAFRGPDGNGQAFGFTGKANKAPQEVWRTTLAKPGFSSPVIWGDKIFLTASDESGCIGAAYKLDTGELLWTTDADEATGKKWVMPEVSPDTGWSASTPYVDAKRMVCHFATGLILCLDHEGKMLWQKDYGVPENMFGQASSLTGYRDRIIVQIDSGSGGLLIGLKADTGEEIFNLWRDVYTAWASPVIVWSNGKPGIAVIANPFAGLFDFETGTNLWQNEVMSGEVALSPVYLDGILYTANQYAPLTALKDGTQLWINEEDFDLPDVSTPAAADGLMYFTNIKGDVVCVDLKNGKEVWKQEFDDGFYSSPIIAAKALWTMNREGLLTVFKTGRKAEKLFELDFGEPIDATLAFCGKMIIVRTVSGSLIGMKAE